MLYYINIKTGSKGGYDFYIAEEDENGGKKKVIAHTSEANYFKVGADEQPVETGLLYMGKTSNK